MKGVSSLKLKVSGSFSWFLEWGLQCKLVVCILSILSRVGI